MVGTSTYSKWPHPLTKNEHGGFTLPSYAFDYAQQVHFPSDPMQPGPVYFLTPRKCAIFGVNLEAIPRQVNFLTDEAGSCGKGSNAVVSQLHYFFEHHGLGETEVFLHADNCSGQNKNSTMIHYLAWRALTNQHSSLTLSLLIVGHTKFSPDWCFGLFKRKFRHSKVSSLNGIACTHCFEKVIKNMKPLYIYIYIFFFFFQGRNELSIIRGGGTKNGSYMPS